MKLEVPSPVNPADMLSRRHITGLAGEEQEEALADWKGTGNGQTKTSPSFLFQPHHLSITHFKLLLAVGNNAIS